MSKQILFKNQARTKLQNGVDTIANTVKVTMGPKGKSVVIMRGSPIFTLDGVTVAQSIEKLQDKVEDMGAQLVKNVAQITNEEAGDGTTTATILTQALLSEGLKGIENGIDPIVLRKAIEEATKKIVEHLKKTSVEVKSIDQMKAVATISSRDPEIGQIIAEIYDKIGKDGIITTEEVKQVGVDYEMVEGMQIDSGYIAPYFITNLERKQAVLEKPYIIVTSEHLRTNEDVSTILNEIASTDSKSLVIIAEDCLGDALATTIVNKMRRVMNTLVVKTPGHGEGKAEYIADICAMTGAKHFSEQTGTSVENAEIGDYGRADRVIAYEKKMIIVGGKGDPKEIQKRIDMIENELKEVEGVYKKENLKSRLAKLKEGVAIIKVGDVTEEASREKQYRIEDAVNATKSSIEEGVVKGGGMALYEASEILEADKEVNPDKRFGMQAVRNAIRRPAMQILENQGKNAEAVIVKGYELSDDVIDPLKVVRVALEQASSVVGLFLVTDAVVYEEPEKNEKNNSQVV